MYILTLNDLPGVFFANKVKLIFFFSSRCACLPTLCAQCSD